MTVKFSFSIKFKVKLKTKFIFENFKVFLSQRVFLNKSLRTISQNFNNKMFINLNIQSIGTIMIKEQFFNSLFDKNSEFYTNMFLTFYSCSGHSSEDFL